MPDKKDFMYYMMCGHGRCFSLIDDNKELFRDIVLYGCLNDISFDLQCEGSRGLFMYNLALEYDDYQYFLNPVIEKFLSLDINQDWHTVNHLCDFIELFAYDYGDKNALNTIEKKYSQLYNMIMTLKWSKKANEVLQCYEYIAIAVMQYNNHERALKIFQDIGAYFIRCRHTSDSDLNSRFLWLWHHAKEQFGENPVTLESDEKNRISKELKRFIRVMSCERIFSHRNIQKMTAEKYIQIADNNKINRGNIIGMSRADNPEKLKLAYAVESEQDYNKKAELLKAFTISRNKFPLNPETLIQYAESGFLNLRTSAIDTLLYLKSDCIHDFALKLLSKNFSTEAVILLINNYRDSDKDLLMKILDTIKIDINDDTGWHGIVLSITDSDNMSFLPDEAVMFVYNRSMCSCCREYAVDELIRRNIFSDDIISECLMDCNDEIRCKAEKLKMLK